MRQLQLKEDITEVSPEDLLALQLSEMGNKARAIILEDLRVLTDFGASPSLNLLKCYERDDAFDFIFVSRRSLSHCNGYFFMYVTRSS